MRSPNEGWRSARSGARRPAATPPVPAPALPGPAAGLPLPAARPTPTHGRWAGRRAPAAAAAAPTVPADGGPENIAASYDWPWKGVTWSLTLVGFLLYIVVITTYELPIGDVAMGAALFGLVLLRTGYHFPATLGWMAAFLVWTAVSGLQSPYQWEVQPHVIDFGKLFLIALVLVNAVRTKENIRLYAVLFLGCFALYPMRGAIFNYVGGYTLYGRALWNHVYANPNDLAALTLLQLSLAVSLLRSEFHRWTRYCVYLGCAMLPILVLMTQSRGAFLALAVFVAFFLAGQRRRARALVSVLAIAAVVVMVAPGGVWKRVSGLKSATTEEGIAAADQEGSAKQRYQIWQVAGRVIADHPAFGVGFGAYPVAHSEYVVTGRGARFARGERDTHSTYLNVLAETGFIGLGLFLGMLGSAFFTAERVRRRWRKVYPDAAQQLYALELGLIAFLVAGIFGSFAKLSFLYLHLMLLVVVAAWLNEAATARQAAVAAPRGAAPIGRGRGGRAGGAAPRPVTLT